jgi:hypothetical protein
MSSSFALIFGFGRLVATEALATTVARRNASGAESCRRLEAVGSAVQSIRPVNLAFADKRWQVGAK